jgi:cysteine synthase A
MKMVNSITECIGNTPLVKLNRIAGDLPGDIAVKCEFFNPVSSVKDRIALAMVEAAEKTGKLKPGGTIIEPTSGNTGVGLACVAAAKGYHCILVMPDTMSIERVMILNALGAKVILTEGAKGMKGAIDKAEEILSATNNAVMPGQFNNPANPEIHYRTTAPEIWEATDGNVNAFIAGVGTGGTVTGVGKYLKEKNKNIKIIAVEPSASAVLSGGQPGPHKIQGIGAGFIPEVLDTSLLDAVVKISHEEAGHFAKRLATEEGIFVGISAGANLAAAYRLAENPENEGKLVVTIMCDTGERYLSTWLYQDV